MRTPDHRRAVALLLECVAAPRAAEATQVRALGCLALLAGEPKGKGAVLAEAGAVELMLARCRAASAAVAAASAAVRSDAAAASSCAARPSAFATSSRSAWALTSSSCRMLKKAAF